MSKPSAFDIRDYKYTLPNQNIIGKRGPRLAGPMYSLGEATGSDINVLGAHRRPDGGLIGELDTSNVRDNILNDSFNHALKPNEVANRMTTNVEKSYPQHSSFDATTDNALKNIQRLKVEGKFAKDVGTKESPASGGYYKGEHKAKIAMDDTVDNVTNTFSHEANHGLETDPYNWDVKWGDRSNELVSNIAGYRHGFDKDMMKEVHPYIDFYNGKFNTNPANEFLRRRTLEGNTNSKMNKEELGGYMKQLNKEAVRLNDKYASDKIFKHKMDKARSEDGDGSNNSWRRNNVINKESSFFSDLAALIR